MPADRKLRDANVKIPNGIEVGATDATASENHDDSFSEEAQSSLRALRQATAEVLSMCVGIERAIDVSTRLGLDRSLAWKVWQVAQGAGECPSPAHIPGALGFDRFLTAAQKSGVAPSRIEHAREAFAKYRQVAADFAGDRATADIMFGALTEEGRSRFETALRRDAFRANAHFLGAHAATVFQVDAILPRAGYLPDVARVRGLIGLTRVRANVPWLVARTTLVHADGPSQELVRTPLRAGAPQDGEDGLGFLLPQFCSSPLPQLHRRLVQGITAEDEVLPGPVGQMHAVNVVTGELHTHMPRRVEGQGGRDAVILPVTTPCERLVFDVIAPKGLLREVEFKVHSTVHTDLPYSRGPEYARIPVPESIQDLGSLSSAPPAPEVTGHADLIAWLLRRLDQDARELNLWRVRMRFPPVPSAATISYR
jgi:hypothetical protein